MFQRKKDNDQVGATFCSINQDPMEHTDYIDYLLNVFGQSDDAFFSEEKNVQLANESEINGRTFLSECPTIFSKQKTEKYKLVKGNLTVKKFMGYLELHKDKIIVSEDIKKENTWEDMTPKTNIDTSLLKQIVSLLKDVAKTHFVLDSNKVITFIFKKVGMAKINYGIRLLSIEDQCEFLESALRAWHTTLIKAILCMMDDVLSVQLIERAAKKQGLLLLIQSIFSKFDRYYTIDLGGIDKNVLKAITEEKDLENLKEYYKNWSLCEKMKPKNKRKQNEIDRVYQERIKKIEERSLELSSFISLSPNSNSIINNKKRKLNNGEALQELSLLAKPIYFTKTTDPDLENFSKDEPELTLMGYSFS